MLVDDFAERSKNFAVLAGASHVVRVPFEVCPFTSAPDGIPGMWWRDDAQRRRSPPPVIPGTDSIDTSWWRPPFRDMIIVSERHEQGLMLVMQADSLKLSSPLVESGTRPVKSDWEAIVALIIEEPDTHEVWCALALRVFSVEGALYDSPKSRAQDTLKVCEILTDRTLVSDERVRIQEGHWFAKMSEHSLDVGNTVATFATTCALMCCRNVRQVATVPDQRTQGIRKRRNKLPLVTWHTLKVGVPGTRASGHATGKGEPLAVHWVRGHFKRYTEDKPLLGRHVGTFWWTPHLAGQDTKRFVGKDYEVTR